MHDNTIVFVPSHEAKTIRGMMEDQWGCDLKDIFTVNTLVRSSKDKLYLITKDAEKLNLHKIRLSSVGLYIAEHKKDQIRLSIEGAQLIGPRASKNIMDVDKDTIARWLKGFDIDADKEYSGFVIVRHGTDFCGSGKHKDGIILNFVPKPRRLAVVH